MLTAKGAAMADTASDCAGAAADTLSRVRAFCKTRNISYVEICGIDSENRLLKGKDGRTYFEVETNMWAADPEQSCETVYLHSNLHHGGIVLRPLYVKLEGAWYSVVTGSAAPDGLPFGAHGSRFTR